MENSFNNSARITSNTQQHEFESDSSVGRNECRAIAFDEKHDTCVGVFDLHRRRGGHILQLQSCLPHLMDCMMREVPVCRKRRAAKQSDGSDEEEGVIVFSFLSSMRSECDEALGATWAPTHQQ